MSIGRPVATLAERAARAVGPHRVMRPRLTGGHAFAPCRPLTPNDSLISGLVCEDGPPSSWQEARALFEFAATLRSAAAARAVDEGARHASGSWNIIWQRAGAAVEELQAAAELHPGNAAIQSDLAVAFLQRAELEQDPLSILDAYSANDSALALDSTVIEAKFNRALILDLLYLRELATSAWRSYLAVDERSHWADEARLRLQELEKPTSTWSAARSKLLQASTAGDSTRIYEVVTAFPWHARDELRTTLMSWGRSFANGDSGASAIRDRALMLGRSVRRTTGDRLWEDIANDIAIGRNPRLAQVAQGLVAYERGRSELDRIDDLDSASVWLDRAFGLLHAARSPASHLVAYDRARVSYQRHTNAGYDDALARFRRLLATTPPEYRWVRALATRNVGFIEFVGANFDVASASFSAAIAQGAGVREPVLDLRTRTDAARLFAMLRGERAGWRELYSAFRTLPSYSDTPSDAQRIFATAAVLSWRRFPRVAPVFQHEFVRLTEVLGDSLLMVSALTREAELLVREGQPTRALESLRRVSAYARGIPGDTTRLLMLADADLVRGQLWLRDRPDSAVRILRAVVERYDASDYLVQASRAKLILANAFVAARAMDSARVVFDDAVSMIARARSGIASHDDRARFLDEARPIIDRIVDFRLSRGDTIGALDFIERMRGRVLLERAERATPNVDTSYRPIDAIRRTLAPHTSILSYAVLDKEIVGWLIRRDGVWMRRIPTGDGIESVAAEFTRLITTRAAGQQIRNASGRLRDLLIAPFESSLPEESKLIVVPDKWLHFVPFAALFDARKQRFLVQSHELAVAPSVQLFFESVVRYQALGSSSTSSVLAVGNPDFDRTVYNLPGLPGAEREARAVARQHSQARLLIGRDATRKAFLDQARSASVIHFAGHGLISTDAPLLSQLVLAPDEDGASSGALYVKDVFELSLPVTRLAILSGCRTADGALSGTEGASSLARALFAAGVPAVIAGLWEVEDRETEAFFASFHADFLRRPDAGAALRRAQLVWIAKGDPWRSARTWAAFQLFGAAEPVGKLAGESVHQS